MMITCSNYILLTQLHTTQLHAYFNEKMYNRTYSNTPGKCVQIATFKNHREFPWKYITRYGNTWELVAMPCKKFKRDGKEKIDNL